MRLDDPDLDRTASEVRDSWLLEAARHQIAFMRAKVQFWRERLSKAVIDEDKIESLADLAQIPIVTKEDLRTIRPAVSLPDEGRRELMVCRWTSGTSGRSLTAVISQKSFFPRWRRRSCSTSTH